MNHLDNQRILGDLARQIEHGEQLSEAQLNYLRESFARIGNGEDANAVFGVRPTRGKSEKDAISRLKHSLILHWMACAIDGPDGLSVSQASEKAMEIVVPIADELFGNSDNFTYDAAYLRKLWYENPDMQNLDRGIFDHAFPYDPI
jgi:hypothetical protein